MAHHGLDRGGGGKGGPGVVEMGHMCAPGRGRSFGCDIDGADHPRNLPSPHRAPIVLGHRGLRPAGPRPDRRGGGRGTTGGDGTGGVAIVHSMDDNSLPLLESDVDPDPFAQFERWFVDAASVVANPEAMAVASADTSGQPSVRMVLLKHWDQDGFVFYTNYGSRKGT